MGTAGAEHDRLRNEAAGSGVFGMLGASQGGGDDQIGDEAQAQGEAAAGA
jgi:hypothetical protein